MNVSYKCVCHPVEQTIAVPDRRPGADLMEWMGMVGDCIKVDHGHMSPRCTATSMTHLKIPIEDEGKGIGFPIVKN